MHITIVESGGFSLSLLSPDRGRAEEIVESVACVILYDSSGAWLGFRIAPATQEGDPLDLPSAISCDFPLHGGFLRQTPDFIEICYEKGIKPAGFVEHICSIAVLEGELYSVRLNLPGKDWGLKYLESFIQRWDRKD